MTRDPRALATTRFLHTTSVTTHYDEGSQSIGHNQIPAQHICQHPLHSSPSVILALRPVGESAVACVHVHGHTEGPAAALRV